VGDDDSRLYRLARPAAQTGRTCPCEGRMTFFGTVWQNEGMRRFILLVVMVCGTWLVAHPQTPAPPPQHEQNRPALGTPAPGIVHASVAVIADPSNSYALYLPSGYSPQKRWPILLVFDPFARGETSVKLFYDAAEKYGFIVAGSNNSRNFEDPSTALRLLWADVKERYAIDPRRLYVAGLSGGARVASSVALACKNCVAAVIACGAGLPQGATVPGPEVADWFLVTGTADFNYPELLHLKDALESHNAVSRFVIYDGPHDWMPKEFTERALAWLQLRAMARGSAPVDKEFVGQQFESRMAEAQSARTSGDILSATREYREIAQDFRMFREVKEQEDLAKSLAESEEFRKAKKNENVALDLQGAVAAKITGFAAGIGQGLVNRSRYITLLQIAVDDIRNDQRGSSPSQKLAMERGLASAFSFAAENGQQLMLKKNYFSAKDMFLAGEIIQPDNAWVSYLLATAYAQLNEKKEAIQELRKAVEKGMTNAKALEDEAFDRIREEQGFRAVAAKLAQVGSKQP
jgi:dienelactone hydrolase